MGETLKPITAKDHDLPKLRRANEPEPTSAESDKMTDEEYVKAMTGLKEVWEQQLSPVSLSQAEKIERDILDELSTLRQKVADWETAKVFHMSCIEKLVERLNDVEDKLRQSVEVYERDEGVNR